MTTPYYYPLFEHMAKNHGLTLTDSEMDEICRSVSEIRCNPYPIMSMVRLLQEVMRAHRDPQSGEYNECEKSPCQWCSSADQAIGEAELKSSDEDNYVAWMRYFRGGVELCDSCDAGAFRVYRHPSKNVTREMREALDGARKWLVRIHERRDDLPKSFLDNCDPKSLADSIRELLSTPAPEVKP